MENNIINNLSNVVLELENKFSEDKIILSYQKAIAEFDELVKKGFAKKRESNLLSFTDAHLNRFVLDTYNSSNLNDKNVFYHSTYSTNF